MTMFRSAKNGGFRVVLVCLLLSQGGCENPQNNITDLREFIAEQQKPTVVKAPTPEEKTPEPWPILILDKMIDPFDINNVLAISSGVREPPVVDSQSDVNAPNLDRRRDTLERFPLDTLSLVGVLESRDAIRAVIRTPLKTVAQVSIGQYMGKNHGKVIWIGRDSLTISAHRKKRSGRWEQYQTELRIERKIDRVPGSQGSNHGAKFYD